MIGFLFKVVLAVALFVLIMRFGMLMLGGLARPHPPPDPGEIRRVNLRYRCSMCGVELKMTAAPDEDPPPPKHCTEEMELVAPVME